MKISERWLREWVDPALSSEELLHRLTMAGLEVDGTEAAAGQFSGVVVGEVLAIEQHPDADKLRVCRVSDGAQEYQVVCGAANVRQGLKIPFARIGAQIGPDFKIKKAKLRGVESHGMLCSAEELGMAESADGLLELPADAPVGAELRAWLGLDDTLIEIDLTPNRGDCLSIAGLAREVAALTRCQVSAVACDPIPASTNQTLTVSLDSPADCPRYLGRVIRNINPESETPLWMQEKLRRSGLRCIDPVVDVTNYVLMELGQPLHAFDLDKIDGGIHVRRAVPDEQLQLLDGREVRLTADTLVIADERKALALAGVMGGKHSAVGPLTTDIFLESAFFAPLAIAGRARSYGLHTDAGHRYERGVDYALPALAMERATALLLDIVGGEPGPVVAAEAALPEVAAVRLRQARIETLLGLHFGEAEVKEILSRLGLSLLQQDAESWTFSVPSWRFDIALEVDLIEELARVHGYDNLPVTTAATRLALQPHSETRTPLRRMRGVLSALGYQEVVSYSFVPKELNAAFVAQADAGMVLANPISQDMAVMRGSLWPGLVKTLAHNQNRQQSRVRLFETGLVFNKNNNELEQKLKVGCLLWGAHFPEQWGASSRLVDFFDLKGDAELLLGLGQDLSTCSFREETHPALQPGQTARIYRGQQALGWLGALHPQLLQVLDLSGKVLVLELDYDALASATLPLAQGLSRFPLVRRDLALVIDEETSATAVCEVLRKAAGSELRELSIFDVYQGGNMQKGKKSLALALTFQHPSRTLNDSDINPIIDSCIKVLEATFKAELR